MKTKLFLFLFAVGTFLTNAQTVTIANVSTVTGSSQGDALGSAAIAKFYGPYGISSNGNIAVTDNRNNKIKYIYSDDSTVLLAGSTTAGFVNGTGAAARFDGPTGIARLRFNDFVVCDTGNNAIRRVTSSFPLGVTTTIAGSSGVAGFLDGNVSVAQFNYPFGIAVNTANDDIYVADTFNHKIRKISGFTVSTFAGSTQGYTDATGSAAQFDTPMGLVMDSNGNVFVLDKARVRKITPAGVVTTFAGGAIAGYLDGTGTAALLGNASSGITIDASNNLYVADINNYRIRKITPAGVVTTYAGTGSVGSIDGDASVASFSTVAGVAIALGTPTLYVADYGNNRIRRVTTTTVTVTAPTISAISTGVTANSASINYSLNPNNGATTSIIKYGLTNTTLMSQVAGFSATGSSASPGTSLIPGLNPGTPYFYKIEATNSAGSTLSAVGSFTTTAVGAAIAEYNFNNTYNNINGNSPFSSNAGTSFVTGRDGTTANGALNINNTGSVATIANLPYGNSPRTISFWAKTNVMGNIYNFLFSYGQSAASAANGANITPTSCDYYGYSNNLSANQTNLNNTWNFYTYTYDGSNAKIYKDGTLLTTVAKNWNTMNNSNLFKLGMGVDNETGYFNGAIDDLKIFNYTLSQADITSLFSSNTLATTENVVNTKDISIFPNPVKDVLNIKSNTDVQSVEIINAVGQKVLQSKGNQINTSKLTAGVYMIQIKDSKNQMTSKKFIKN